jgi:hypothetical protein
MNAEVIRLNLGRNGLPVRPVDARLAIRNLVAGTPKPFTDSAILMSSELFTNALLHTSGLCSVMATFNRQVGVLRVEVSDDQPAVYVRPSEPKRLAGAGGMGLHIVELLSERWGTILAATSKVVWFELHQPGSPLHSDPLAAPKEHAES